MRILLALAGIIAAVARGVDIHGTVTLPPGAATPVSSVQLSLNGGEGERFASVLVNGSFTFWNVPRGKTYMLEVLAPALTWPMYKLQVSAVGDGEGGDKIAVVEYKYPGAPKLASAYPLRIAPLPVPPVYFEERAAMSIWSFLKNPQFLIMGVMALLMFALPAMQKNMDPETRREMEQQQAMMSDPFAAFQKLMRGEVDEPREAPQSAPRVTQGSREERRGNARKR